MSRHRKERKPPALVVMAADIANRDRESHTGPTANQAYHDAVRAHAAVAELARCAEGLLFSIQLKHPAVVRHNWQRSLLAALDGVREQDNG